MIPAMATINPRRKRATPNPDHVQRLHVPAPSDAEIEARLDAVVKPAVFADSITIGSSASAIVC